jgi:uncharacterized protein (TIGR00369 family)
MSIAAVTARLVRRRHETAGDVVTEKKWDRDRILAHVAAYLPVAAMFGIDIIAADAERGRVRLIGNAQITRPGGSIAGPVLFAMADIATYALTLALRQEDTAATSSLLMNFLRPAFSPPLIAEAVPLRVGRGLLTYDVRIWSEADGPERLIAQAVATWAAAAIAAVS